MATPLDVNATHILHGKWISLSFCFCFLYSFLFRDEILFTYTKLIRVTNWIALIGIVLKVEDRRDTEVPSTRKRSIEELISVAGW